MSKMKDRFIEQLANKGLEICDELDFNIWTLEKQIQERTNHIRSVILLATAYGLPEQKLRKRIIELYPELLQEQVDEFLTNYEPQHKCN